MRMSTVVLAAAALTAAAAPSRADEAILKGVYLKSQALCAQAKKETLQPVIEAGNLVLSERGLDAIEYNCAFVQVLRHPRLDNAWIATAFCEEPGFSSPDVFSIMRREPGSVEIASLQESASGNAGMEEGAQIPAETTPKSGDGVADVPAVAPDEPMPEDPGSLSGLGGTYYLCDGVTMP